MPTATPRSQSFCARSLLPLLFAALAFFGIHSASAQPIVGLTNKIAFAKPVEVCMESEGTVKLTVIRADGMRGAFSVDAYVAVDTNAIVAATFKPVTLNFADYQLSSSFTLPIVNNTKPNTNAAFAKVTLALTNLVVVPGQNPAYGAVLDPKGSTMELDVYDDDDLTTISFQKVNYAGNEGDTLTFGFKLGGSPGDPADLANISVDYTILAPTRSQLAPGADLATVPDDLDPSVATSGTISFASGTTQTLDVQLGKDQLVEFDEEFVVILSNPKGDTADPKDTNTPPKRLNYKVNGQSFARGRILFNTNFVTHPMPAGAVDQTFNPDNALPLQLRHPGANGPVTALAVDFNRTNYYVAGNFTAVDAVTRHGLARLTSTGTVDQAFIPAQNVNGPVTSVDIYRNGPLKDDVVLGGGFTSVGGEARNSVARYLPNGSLDLGFQLGLGANGPIYAVKTEGDNSVLVAGNFTMFDGVPRGGIARLKPSGQLDETAFTGAGANGPIYDLSVEIARPFRIVQSRTDATNTVQISNIVDSNVGIVELTYNNLGFTNSWRVTFGSSTVFLRQSLTNDFTLVTNQVDQTVTTNWIPVTVVLDLPVQAQPVNDLLISITPVPNPPDNPVSWSVSALVTPLGTKSVAAVGDFTSFNQAPLSRIAKTDATGTVDQTFASNIGTGVSGPVYAIDRDDITGSYVIGGSFGAFNSYPVGNIAALTRDGVFEVDFAAGSGADNTIRDIFIEKSDRTSDPNRLHKIYIGGDFLKFNGSRRIFLARLMPEGFLDTSFMDSAFNQFAGFPSTSGLAPDGSIAAITVGRNPDPVVGGIFDLVGGGPGRATVKPRQNVARLVGGGTPGPGNFTAIAPIFGADEDGETLIANYSLTNAATITPVAFGAVAVQTVDESAIAGQDYTALKVIGTNIISSVTNYFLQVPIIDDNVIEGDEEFLITLPDIIGRYSLGGEPIYPEMAYGEISTVTGRIVENDVPPAVFSFSQPEYNVDENRGLATIEIFRTGNVNDRVTVSFSAVPSGTTNSASSPEDFSAVTNQVVTFAPGVTNATVTVPIRDDLIVEADETVALSIGGPSSGGTINTNLATAVLNIIDNDLPAGKIDFTFAGFTVVEGQPNAVVTAVRSGGNVGFITVDYQTVDGTATNGLDYLARTGTLRWNDRDISTQTILIPIVDDSIVEAPETFTVQLLNPSQAGIIGTRHPTATVTIYDNDFFGDLQFSAPRYFADENGISAAIQVIRRNGSAQTVSVNYGTAPGTNSTTAAVPGKDYNNVSGTLTFGPGETAKTFTVPILDDTDPDGTRDVLLTLSSPVNGSLGTNSVATLSILDNETVNVPAGGVDTDFVTSDGANSVVNAVAIQNEGTTNAAGRKILIAGDFTLFNHIARDRIARLNNDGSLDRNYAVQTRIDAAVRAMIVQPDGKVVIGGHFNSVDDSTVKYVARLNTVGQLDTSFQPGAGPDNAVYALASTLAGNPTNNLYRILIGGDFVNFNSQPRQRIAMLNPDGTLDPNFDPAAGPNSSVYAIAVQRDQKILIGGDFITVAGIPRAHIARLNPDGSLDTTFDPADGFDGSVRSIAIQADDKILVGGNFSNYNVTARRRIARLNVDGSNDASFDPGTGADAIVNSIVVQPDANILVAGDFISFNGEQRRSLVRLLPDGSIDYSINFGKGPNGVVNSLAVQSDREIVIGGDFTEVDALPRNRVARVYGGSFLGSGSLEFSAPLYSVNEGAGSVTLEIRRTGGLAGTVSATYQTTGITATPGADYVETTNTITFGPGEMFHTITIPLIDDFIPEPNEYVQVSLRDPVGGTIGRQPVSTIEIVSDDTRISFASDNFVVNENAPGGRANITITREGVNSQPINVVFTTQDGTATAGSDYTATTQTITFGPTDTVKFVSVPILDDAIVEGDETVNLHLALVDSAPDVTLGASAATLTIVDNDSAPGTLQFAGSAFVDENAGSVTLTVTRNGGKLGTVSVQYATQDGTAKAPGDYLASSGILTFQQTDTAKTITIPISDDQEVEGNESFLVNLSNPTGGAVLGPKATTTVVIIDNDFGPGSLDQSFDIGSGAAGTVNDIVIQPDGKIVVGGDFTDFANSGHPRLVRLLPTGSVDPDFSSGRGPSGPVYSVDLATGGRIVAGGAFRSFNSLDRSYYIRLTPSGAPDPSMTVSPGLDGAVRTLRTQLDQNVVIGGEFTSPADRAGRVLVSGQFDVSFNVGAGANDTVLDAQVQSDGKVLLGGLFTQFGNLQRGHIVRLLTNGLVDVSFNTAVGADGPVNAILPLSDGRTIVGGDFTHFNGTPATRVVALNTDGSVDTNFFTATGPDGPVYALAQQASGKIVIGGDFSFVQDQPRQRVARLNRNGTLDDSFRPGLGPDHAVYDIEIQSDQRILIAGAFQNVNGFPRAGIARLNTETLKISSVSINGTDLVLAFESSSGVSYDIEATSDLGNPNSWATVDTVTASGSSTQVTVPMNSGYRFFRIKPSAP